MDDEIWDEEEWEAYLKARDAEVNHFLDLVFAFLSKHPRPQGRAAQQAWEQNLRQYMLDRGISPEEQALTFLFAEAEEATSEAEEEALYFDPEDDELDVPLHTVDDFPLYQQAVSIGAAVLQWANALPAGRKDSTLVQACAHTTQIAVNIAKGYRMGFEREMMGGCIAYAKRALQNANAALQNLQEMKTAPYMEPSQYRIFYEQLFEVRNQTGLYVQDLRARFDLGIE